MPKVQIDLPEDVYKSLKIKAKDRLQSLRSYIAYDLIEQVRNPDKYKYKHIDTSALPDDTVITTKIKADRPLTEDERIEAFKKLMKTILGSPDAVKIEECYLQPDNNYYEFAQGQEGKFLRWAYDMPKEKQIEYLKEWRQYIDNE